MWCLKERKHTKKTPEFTDTENRLMGCQRWEMEVGKGGQKIQTSSYKVNKSRGCNAQHGNYSQSYCNLYLKAAKKGRSKGFSSQEKNIWGRMLMRHCDDHFTTYTNIKSLCCAAEININLCSITLQFFKKHYP